MNQLHNLTGLLTIEAEFLSILVFGLLCELTFVLMKKIRKL